MKRATVGLRAPRFSRACRYCPVFQPGSPKRMSCADFTIIRESTSSFSGDWSRLKGETSLFVWAQPAVRIATNIAATKLRFAEAIFAERYREATHTPDNSVLGIVVIFLDPRGGVAAARLDDIRNMAQWSANQRCLS